MSLENNTPLAFLKVGDIEHNKQLQSGLIRFGSLKTYARSEDSSRLDKLETTVYLESIPENHILTLCHPDLHETKIKLIKGDIRQTDDGLGNAFCLYSVLSTANQDSGWQLGTEMLRKGNSILVISNTNEFIKRVKSAAENKGLKLYYGFVEYKKFDGFTGKKSVFEKDLSFAPECEFRFYIRFSNTSDFECLDVGDLSDISIIVKCDIAVGGPRFLLKIKES